MPYLISTQLYLIVCIYFPLIIHSADQSANYDSDVYFEVLEPTEINYTFRCRSSKEFGVRFDEYLKNIYLIPTQPFNGCGALQNRFDLKGNIALIERGGCSFVTKSVQAEKSGARGVLIMDNDPTADDYFVQMLDDTTGRFVNIPAMFLQYRDGHLILDSIEKNQMIGARINIPLNLTYNEILKVPKAPGSYWL